MHNGLSMRTTAILAVFILVGTSLLAADKDLYQQAKCDRCHAVASEGIEATTKSARMKGPDLDGLGESRTAEWIVQYVKKEVNLDGKDHRSKYTGTDSDLETIAEWLVTLPAK